MAVALHSLLFLFCFSLKLLETASLSLCQTRELFYPVSGLSHLPISASHVKLLVTSGESTRVSGQRASSTNARKASLQVFAAGQGTEIVAEQKRGRFVTSLNQRTVEWAFGVQVALTIPLGAVQPV